MTQFTLICALLSCLLLPQHFAEDVPFGVRLGSSHGVDGFSNHNNSIITDEDNYVNDVFMGMKWQCVEYARRYLYVTRGMTFDGVVAAINIWDLPTVTSLSSGLQYEFLQRPNGQSTFPPKEGDLVIWPQQGTDTPFGHVAVVVDVQYTAQGLNVFIAEQNFLNEPWESPEGYARTLKGTVAGELYSLSDPGYQITGWMSVGHPLKKPEAVKAAPTWDTTMLGLLALPVFITIVGIAFLAWKRRKEDGSRRHDDGHLLLDEDQVISTPLHRLDPSGEELELEHIR